MHYTVHIEEIRDSGLDYRRELPREFVEAAVSAGQSGFHTEGPAGFTARFEKKSGRVLLNGRLALRVNGPCKRCLTPVVSPLDVEFSLNFVKAVEGEHGSKESPPDDESRASFDLVEADTELFDGHQIDLDDLLREQLVLGLPMDVLCRPDCKGLCVVCGQDRNLAACQHEQKPPDPRWAALKDLKLPN